jgi:hypothetical protein
MARSLKQVEKSNFEIGDLVRIKEGTHQDEIPDSRVGLIVGVAHARSDAEHRTIYEVQMGRSVLNFHQMFLEKLST